MSKSRNNRTPKTSEHPKPRGLSIFSVVAVVMGAVDFLIHHGAEVVTILDFFRPWLPFG